VIGSRSARCFSKSSRLSERLKRGIPPSLVSKTSSTPVAERFDWVLSSGRKRLGSRLALSGRGQSAKGRSADDDPLFAVHPEGDFKS
jgi:hypothetical protein